MNVCPELPEDVVQRLQGEAERRGVTLREVLVEAATEWLERQDGETERERAIRRLAQHPGIHRGVRPQGAPETWHPVNLPGRALSEIVIEERGER